MKIAAKKLISEKRIVIDGRVQRKNGEASCISPHGLE